MSTPSDRGDRWISGYAWLAGGCGPPSIGHLPRRAAALVPRVAGTGGASDVVAPDNPERRRLNFLYTNGHALPGLECNHRSIRQGTPALPTLGDPVIGRPIRLP